MKKLALKPKALGLAVLLTAALSLHSGPVRTQRRPVIGLPSVPAGGVPAAPLVQGQLLVKFRDTVSLPLRVAAMAAYESRPVARISRLGVYVVELPADASVEEMAAAYGRNPDVEYAEPNFLCRVAATPNDTLFKYQYALSNTGQVIGTVPGSPQGKASADIKAPAAWEETKGRSDVIVAIVDTGVDLLHIDLKNKLKSAGRDVINNDYDATDDFWHGTAVAGVAAADTNNNEGIAGVAWNAKILPVKVLDNKGVGGVDKVAEGIIWAADNGAGVINLSLGTEAPSLTLRDALKYAFDKGIVITAAAGNGGGAVLYPAAYDNYVLAVAATDYNDVRWTSSNSGAEVDVAAPGVRILSTVPTWYFGPATLPYGYADGTSMAAPQAAGLAALIKGLKPWLKPAEILAVIRLSSDDVNSTQYKGKDEFLGYGRINMAKALVPLKLETVEPPIR